MTRRQGAGLLATIIATMLLAACSGTGPAPAPSGTASVAADAPASSPATAPASSPAAAPAESRQTSSISVLLPAPLNIPLAARAAKAVSVVESDDARGWYAVLETEVGNGAAVVGTLAAALEDAGFQVTREGLDAHAVRRARPQSSGPAAQATAPAAPVAVPSADPGPVDPFAATLPTSTFVEQPPKPGKIADAWVELRVLQVQAPAGAPAAGSDLVSVVLVQRSDQAPVGSAAP